jgi:hypothetical protein
MSPERKFLNFSNILKYNINIISSLEDTLEAIKKIKDTKYNHNDTAEQEEDSMLASIKLMSLSLIIHQLLREIHNEIELEVQNKQYN